MTQSPACRRRPSCHLWVEGKVGTEASTSHPQLCNGQLALSVTPGDNSVLLLVALQVLPLPTKPFHSSPTGTWLQVWLSPSVWP